MRSFFGHHRHNMLPVGDVQEELSGQHGQARLALLGCGMARLRMPGPQARALAAEVFLVAAQAEGALAPGAACGGVRARTRGQRVGGKQSEGLCFGIRARRPRSEMPGPWRKEPGPTKTAQRNDTPLRASLALSGLGAVPRTWRPGVFPHCRKRVSRRAPGRDQSRCNEPGQAAVPRESHAKCLSRRGRGGDCLSPALFGWVEYEKEAPGTRPLPPLPVQEARRAVLCRRSARHACEAVSQKNCRNPASGCCGARAKETGAGTLTFQACPRPSRSFGW